MSCGLGKTLSGGSTKPMSYLKKMIDDTPKFAVGPVVSLTHTFLPLSPLDLVKP
jgi:hypothetical protein